MNEFLWRVRFHSSAVSCLSESLFFFLSGVNFGFWSMRHWSENACEHVCGGGGVTGGDSISCSKGRVEAECDHLWWHVVSSVCQTVSCVYFNVWFGACVCARVSQINYKGFFKELRVFEWNMNKIHEPQFIKAIGSFWQEELCCDRSGLGTFKSMSHPCRTQLVIQDWLLQPHPLWHQVAFADLRSQC